MIGSRNYISRGSTKEISILKGTYEYVSMRAYGIDTSTIKLKTNEDIISLETGTASPTIRGEKVGTTQITAKDSLDREFTIDVKVFEQKNDTSLENTGVTADIVNFNTILKSNGELWRVNSSTTAERIDVNVKKYVSNIIYTDIYDNKNIYGSSYEFGGITENILYNNGNLKIKYTLDQIANTNLHIKSELNVSNVKDISHSFYLTNNGELYNINTNNVTGELETEKVMEDVKKLVNECVVKNDNTTWLKQTDGYVKIADFEIKDQFLSQIIDMNDTLWHMNTYPAFITESGLTKAQENYSGFNIKNFYGIYTALNDDGLLHLPQSEALKILTDVVELDSDVTYTATDIMVREDGSIWLYNNATGLTKVTSSTVIENWDDTKLTEDEIYLRNTEMKSKKLANKIGLAGLTANKEVGDFINENNFYLGYNVKVFNMQDQLLADNAFVGTGDRIKLYNGDKLIKEYTAILYGDTDGDGEITAVDALAIIMNRTKKREFDDIAYVEAGRLESTGDEVPSAIDALAIIMYKTGKYTINQSK